MFKKIINPSLNLIPTIVRFFLTFVVADKLSVSFFGNYSLTTTIVGLIISLLVFEFFLFTTKTIVNNNDNYVNPTLNQVVFHVVIILLAYPLFLFPIKYFIDLTLLQIVILFFVILSELIGRTLERTMFAINKTTYAYLVGAIKSGIWPIVLIWLIACDFVSDFSSFLNILFILWSIGNLLQVLILGTYLFKFNDIANFKINIKWIKEGVIVSLPLLMSSFGLLVLLNAGRFIIDIYGTKSDVGVYSFYFQLANVFKLVVNAGILTVAYPKIINISGKPNNTKKLNSLILKIQIEIILFTFLAFIFGYFFLDTFLSMVDKIEFISNSIYFYYMIIGISLITSSNIFYYILFGLNKRKEIIYSAIIALILSLVSTLILVCFYKLNGVIYGFILSGIILYITRFLYYKKGKITNYKGYSKNGLVD